MKFGVVVFPGSNCDRDMINALQIDMKQEVISLWHKDKDLSMFTTDDCIVLPGGFSYGDYLRCGAIARFSPMMQSVIDFANAGGKVLGICNGFQILCEAGLLPGAMLRNEGLRFVCRDVFLRVESKRTPFTLAINKGDVLRMPIAHGDGNWTAEKRVYEEMLARDQVVFRYVRSDGSRGEGANPNGSLDDVAGICNVKGNIVGLMPHPERAAENLLGGTDGARLFKSFATTRMAMHGA